MGCPNAVFMIPSDNSVRVSCVEKGHQSFRACLTSGYIRRISGRKVAPTHLELINVRTMPIRLEREEPKSVAVLQMDDRQDVFPLVFWDSRDLTYRLISIVITTYQHGDVSPEATGRRSSKCEVVRQALSGCCRLCKMKGNYARTTPECCHWMMPSLPDLPRRHQMYIRIQHALV